MQRRDFLTSVLAGGAVLRLRTAAAQQPSGNVFFERAAAGTPHKGKVLAAIQAHSDDIPLSASGTVAKLVKEGYWFAPPTMTWATFPDSERPAPSVKTCWATSATTTRWRASSALNESSI